MFKWCCFDFCMFNITILILFLGTDAYKTPVEPSMFTLEYIKNPASQYWQFF